MTVSDAGSARPGGRPRTPVHLWIVGVPAVLWNAAGVFDFVATQIRFEPYMSQFTQEQLDYFYGFPAWVHVLWGVAIGTALLGSMAILLRRRWAVTLFAVSLGAMAVTTVYTFAFTNGAEVMGPEATYVSIAVAVIAVLLLLYTWRMAKRGVLA